MGHTHTYTDTSRINCAFVAEAIKSTQTHARARLPYPYGRKTVFSCFSLYECRFLSVSLFKHKLPKKPGASVSFTRICSNFATPEFKVTRTHTHRHRTNCSNFPIKGKFPASESEWKDNARPTGDVFAGAVRVVEGFPYQTLRMPFCD